MPSSFIAARHLSVPSSLKGGAIAIGNFDGMHRGHQTVIGAAVDAAAARGEPALALTFEPHPRDIFRPENPVFRLTPPKIKTRLAEALGLDGFVTVDFNADFARLDPETFVKTVLVDELAIRHVAVGWNFHFGAGRHGTTARLAELGAKYGFTVEILPPFETEDGFTVSSSAVRDRLAEGNLAEATGLMGWHWYFDGVVIDGDKRGRTIGFPTANIRLPDQVRLAHGVYAVYADIDGVRHIGAANWGRRPMFDNGKAVFETYVLDYTGDLYRKTITVTPIAYLRPELRFNGVNALIAQMHQDVAETRALLQSFDGFTALDRALAATTVA
jgi:riboflavin kinase/FMN adenylyltransferase